LSQASVDSIIARAERVFGEVARPQHFTNRDHCCECRDHDEELQPFTPATIPRCSLGNMAWDPITFCTDEAFRYWLPGMIRVVLTENGDDNYYEQFVWHLNAVEGGHDRYAACTDEERVVVAETLAFLLEHRSEEIERECAAGDLLCAIEIWSN